ncbi:hypothetical protein [Thermococcus sp.]
MSVPYRGELNCRTHNKTEKVNIGPLDLRRSLISSLIGLIVAVLMGISPRTSVRCLLGESLGFCLIIAALRRTAGTFPDISLTGMILLVLTPGFLKYLIVKFIS